MPQQIIKPPKNNDKSLVRNWADWFSRSYGAKVFPITGKKPMLKNWKFLASTDVNDFTDEMWKLATGYGILLDQFIVVDFDSDDIDLMEATMPWLPETLIVRTYRGYHFYYKGYLDKKWSMRPEAPVDVLHGGFAVGPGSIHPASNTDVGNIYYSIKWRTSSLSICDAPQEIYQISKGGNVEYEYSENPIAKLKAKIPLTQLYDYYGGETKIDPNTEGEVLVRCIMPDHLDKEPSLSINNTKSVFFCHTDGCHVKGDQITMIKLMDELSDIQAWNKFKKLAGIEEDGEPESKLYWAKDTSSWGTKLANITAKNPNNNSESYDLWNSLQVLSYIRDIALSSLISPQALLGACLAVGAAVVGSKWILPPLRGIGNPSPLTVHVAIVGQAGAGKTSILSAVQQAFDWPEYPLTKIAKVWQTDEGYYFDDRSGKSPATASGFRAAFGDRPPGKRLKPRDHTRAGLWFYYDEAKILLDQSVDGFGPTLRTAWSGTGLSSYTATDELQANILGWGYGYGLITNAHIETTAFNILDVSSGEGDGDRWIGLSAHDPLTDTPDVPKGPWPIKVWEGGDRPFRLSTDIPMVSPDRYTFTVDSRISSDLIKKQISQRRGHIPPNILEGQHIDLIRLRVAGLLALLEGRDPIIDLHLWDVAGAILTLSTQVRDLAVRANLETQSRLVHKQAAEKIEFVRATKKIDERQEQIIEVVARRMAAKSHRRTHPQTFGTLCQVVGADYTRWDELGLARSVLNENALERCLDRGWIAQDPETGKLVKGNVFPPPRKGFTYESPPPPGVTPV